MGQEISLEDRLLRLKKTIDSYKTDLDQAKGRKAELLRTLEDSFGVKSLKEAADKLKELDTDILALEETIKADLERLENDVIHTEQN